MTRSPESVGVAVGVGEREPKAVAVTVGVGDRLNVGDIVGDGLGLRDGVEVGSGLRVAVAVWRGVFVGEELGVRVAMGLGVGSTPHAVGSVISQSAQAVLPIPSDPVVGYFTSTPEASVKLK